jgi:hypothetical protein
MTRLLRKLMCLLGKHQMLYVKFRDENRKSYCCFMCGYEDRFSSQLVSDYYFMSVPSKNYYLNK